MNEVEFSALLHRRLELIENVLGEKAKEYVRNGDRLHNFRRAAEISGLTKEEVLWNGFALKHLTSVFDIVDDIKKGKLPSKELADEKIGDLINYLILLEACIEDSREEEPPMY